VTSTKKNYKISYTLEKRGEIVKKKRKVYWSHDEALITILLVSS
jgi:hypothetical protein